MNAIYKKMVFPVVSICVVFLFSCYFFLAGCNDDTVDKLFTRADLVYTTVKAMVNDPIVHAFIPDDTLAILKVTEAQYLVAKNIYESGGYNDDTLSMLVNCGDQMLVALDSVQDKLPDEWKPKLSFVKLSLTALNTYLKTKQVPETLPAEPEKLTDVEKTS